MGNCQFENCQNEATKTYSRPTTEDEQHRQRNESGISFNVLKKVFVCETHEEEAKKEFPFIVYQEPYTPA